MRRPTAPAATGARPVLTRLAVLLDRGAQTQVGVDPATALLVEAGPLPALLRLADGRRTLAELVDLGADRGLAEAVVRDTFASLARSGLVVDACSPGRPTAARPQPGPDPVPPRATVRLLGAGGLGQRIAELLVQAGLTVLYLWDPAPVERTLVRGTGAAATRGEALRARLQHRDASLSRGPLRVTALNHWSKPDAGGVDLTVLSLESPEPDRLVTEHLTRLDQAHLLVRSWGTGVSVGPLVLPGQTSCVRCADLLRTDTDPGWPGLLPQLARLQLPACPLLRDWAAGWAALQATAFLRGGLPECAGVTLEVSERDLVLRRRVWPPHPGCGCGWSGTTEWAHE